MKIIYFVLSSLLFTTIAICQDSLYLVGTITGVSTTDMITDVKGVGDINGDGYDDFMVSSGFHVVKLYLGSSKLNLTPDIIFHYPDKESTNSIGGCAGIGDINGDGYNDFLLSGSYDNGAGGKGKVFLYLGGTKIDTIPIKEFTEPWIKDWFGHTMQGVGDINKDGYADFVIGSPYNWTDGKGRFYLFWGGDTISWERSITITSDTTEDFFGASVANIGDINGEGYDDLAIGAPQSGKVYIYYGGKTIHTTPDSILNPNHFDDEFGRIINNAGDINKDGIIDFCIAGERNIFIYNGLKKFDNPLLLNGFLLGYGGYINIETDFDINNDGFNDFIIGNTNYRNSDSVMVGGAFVYFGGKNIDTVYKFKLEGEHKWDEFSKIITTADINGDGYDELLIMAPSYPDYNNPLGKVYIYSNKRITNVKGCKETTPSQCELYQNYPNPFNPNTVISYQLPVTCYINLKVYDLLGREIKTLVDEKQNVGVHTINFSSSGLSSGVYFYRLTAGQYNTQKSMFLVK